MEGRSFGVRRLSVRSVLLFGRQLRLFLWPAPMPRFDTKSPFIGLGVGLVVG